MLATVTLRNIATLRIKPVKIQHETLLLSLGILAFPITSAHASTVQSISATEAETGTAPILNVCPVQGYNLNFLQLKGGIVQAKLVDPSQTHLTFDVEKPSHETPAKVVYLRRIEQLKFQGLPSAKNGQMTTLSVLTTARKLYRFRVAFGCPSKYDTGILNSPIASRRTRRFATPVPTERPAAIREEQKDPVVPKPKARVSQATRLQPQQPPQPVDIPVPEPKEEAPEGEGGEVPPLPIETTYVSEQQAPKPTEVNLSPSKVAWHINRGLHVAKGKGEINYGTYTYRKWQSVIALVRRGNSLESSIRRANANPKVGAVLLKYGGLK